MATTTTGPSGSYLFTNVDPGTYVIEVAASNFGSGQPLDGYAVTSGPQSEGANTSTARTVIAGDIRVDADFGFEPTPCPDEPCGGALDLGVAFGNAGIVVCRDGAAEGLRSDAKGEWRV